MCRVSIYLGIIALIVSSVVVVRFQNEIMNWQEGLERELMEVQLTETGPLHPDLLTKLSEKELEFLGVGGLEFYQAYKEFPVQTEEVYSMFWKDSVFHRNVKKYGVHVVLLMKAYKDDTSALTKAQMDSMDWASTKIKQAKDYGQGWLDWWNNTSTAPTTTTTKEVEVADVDPGIKRAYACLFSIDEMGHEFLSRFDFTADGTVRYQAIHGVISTAEQFLASGLERVEKKIKAGEKLTGGDIFEASLDVAAFAAFAKALKVAKVAKATEGIEAASKASKIVEATEVTGKTVKTGEAASKTGKFARIAEVSKSAVSGTYGLWKSSKLFRIACYTGGIYAIAMHPRLVNAALGWLAEQMGWNPLLVQFVFWIVFVTAILHLLWAVSILWIPFRWAMAKPATKAAAKRWFTPHKLQPVCVVCGHKHTFEDPVPVALAPAEAAKA